MGGQASWGDCASWDRRRGGGILKMSLNCHKQGVDKPVNAVNNNLSRQSAFKMTNLSWFHLKIGIEHL